MNLGDAEDAALNYFAQQGFQIQEWPFLDPSLEWRPRAMITRRRRNHEDKAVIVVRENCASYKEPHNWEPIVEARQKFSDLPIYFIVPESPNIEPLRTELMELGVGLYVIDPDANLMKIFQDRVPFDDLVITYPIDPNKPYRNKQNVLKVLANCDNYIWWLDKHFTSEGLEYLYDYLMNWPSRRPLSQIKILGSDLIKPNEITRLRNDFPKFSVEANSVHVIAEMRLIMDRNTLGLFHDRYIISQNISFNVLPTKSLASGQQGSLTLEENPPDFMTLWRIAIPL